MEALQQKGVMFLSAAGTENHPVSRNLFFTAPVKYSVAAIKAALCELSEGFCFFSQNVSITPPVWAAVQTATLPTCIFGTQTLHWSLTLLLHNVIRGAKHNKKGSGK